MSEGCVAERPSTRGAQVAAVGVDTADVGEVGRSLDAYADRYRDFLLSPRERAEQAGLTGRALVLDTARRWAAKEAVTKVLGPSDADPWPWRHIEVVGDARRPTVRLHGRPRELADRLEIHELVVEAPVEAPDLPRRSTYLTDTITVTAVGLRPDRTADQPTPPQEGTP